MSLYYLGAFPPGYGGVTIKNRNLYQAISEKTVISKVDFNLIKRKKISEMIRLIRVFICRNNYFVVGISGRKNRRLITSLLHRFNRKAMKKSILMVMGGALAEDIENNSEYLSELKLYKKIYVESESLREKLIKRGLNNIEVYPNCRFKLENQMEARPIDGKIKCVFFSLIQPEKGVDLILEIVEELSDVEFHFYGGVVSSYNNTFMESVKNKSNVFYHGIYRGSEEEKCIELNQYDILLLPTRCPTEGLPGVLIEGKMAGLAEVVTNHNYNKEFVEHGVSGIVLKENTSQQLKLEIANLSQNIMVLESMKRCSKDSAEKYYIERYIPDILEALGNGEM